jgi:hypothetical protein
MRHSFGSFHAHKGVPLLHVAKWMGDTLRTVEKHYAHLQVDRSWFDRSHKIAQKRTALEDDGRIVSLDDAA